MSTTTQNQPMPTKANLDNLTDNIVADLRVLAGEDVGPSNVSWQDVAGTLATSLEIFARALHEERRGRVSFNGARPTNQVLRLLDSIRQ